MLTTEPLWMNFQPSFLSASTIHLSRNIKQTQKGGGGWHYIQNGVLASNQYTAGITEQDISVRI